MRFQVRLFQKKQRQTKLQMNSSVMTKYFKTISILDICRCIARYTGNWKQGETEKMCGGATCMYDGPHPVHSRRRIHSCVVPNLLKLMACRVKTRRFPSERREKTQDCQISLCEYPPLAGAINFTSERQTLRQHLEQQEAHRVNEGGPAPHSYAVTRFILSRSCGSGTLQRNCSRSARPRPPRTPRRNVR